MDQQSKSLEQKLNETSDTFWQGHPKIRSYGHRLAVKQENEEISLKIPKDDLEIIQKLYHKVYPDSGRKRGALLRYIADLRNKHEIGEVVTKDFFSVLIRKL